MVGRKAGPAFWGSSLEQQQLMLWQCRPVAGAMLRAHLIFPTLGRRDLFLWFVGEDTETRV